LLCGYSVERVQHDYGADLGLLTYNPDGEVENGQVYVQLKATDHLDVLRNGQAIAFPVKRADLELWLREPMPYILVVYDAQADVAYWLYVQAYFARLQDFNLDRTGRTVTVYIPKANVLDESATRRFARFKESMLEQTEGVVHHE
jgi:hypothetical protein